MTKGFDELIEFVLAEIALAGDRGASIPDFRRFIQEFYAQPDPDSSGRRFGTQEAPPVVLDDRVYEKVWGWIQEHPDFVVKDEWKGMRGVSLAEIEAGDVDGRPEDATIFRDAGGSEDVLQSGNTTKPGNDTINEHQLEDATTSSNVTEPKKDTSSSRSKKYDYGRDLMRREPTHPVPQPPAKGFRMHATENRVWKAIAGHSIDYKKLPILEFECLQVICAAGKKGIIQPDLTTATGQDKRSTPKRTDNLSEKGYIEKKVVNVRGLRTSLCVHKRYVVKNAGVTRNQSRATDVPTDSKDVFIDGILIMGNLISYLYELLKDIRIVSQVDLRRKLGIPNVKNWQGKALEGALTRLKNIEYISRTKARVQGRKDKIALCVKLLRAPTDDDYRILAVTHVNQPTMTNSILEEDEGGDDDLRDLDLEADLDDDEVVLDAARIPPQWTPDRVITSFLFDAIDAAGAKGINSEDLRTASLGKFWKRPLEAMLVRFTDTWEQNQPSHIKHFSVIRDTAITQERKFIHYIFRSYNNFQKAVDANETEWAAVQDPKKAVDKKGAKFKESKNVKEVQLDEWGFPVLSPKLFTNGTGAATLQECRESMNELVLSNSWDNRLIENLGYQRIKPARSKGVKSEKPRKLYTEKQVERMTAKYPYCDPIAIKIPKLFKKRMEAGTPASQTPAPGAIKPSRTLSSVPPPSTAGAQSFVPQSASPVGDAMDINTPMDVDTPVQATRDTRQLPSLSAFIPQPRRAPHRRNTEEPNGYLNAEQLREWRLQNGFSIAGRLTIPARKMLEEQGLIPPLAPKSKTVKLGRPPKAGKAAKGNKTPKGKKTLKEKGLVDGSVGGPTSSTFTSVNARDYQPSPVTPVQTAQEVPEQAGQAATGAPSTGPVSPDVDGIPENRTSPTPNAIQGTDETPTNVDDESGRSRKRSRLDMEEASSLETPQSGEAPGRTSTPLASLDTTAADEPAKRVRKKYKSWAEIAEESLSRFIPEDTPTEPNAAASVVETTEQVDSANLGATPGPSVQTPSIATPVRATQQDHVAAQVEAILARFNDRTEPGVYINPFATRRIARGRPRRALIAVFKSTRLDELGLPLDPRPPEQLKKGKEMAPVTLGGRPQPWRNRRKPLTQEEAIAEESVGPVNTEMSDVVEGNADGQQAAAPDGVTSPLKRKSSPEELVGNGDKRQRTSTGSPDGDAMPAFASSSSTFHQWTGTFSTKFVPPDALFEFGSTRTVTTEPPPGSPEIGLNDEQPAAQQTSATPETSSVLPEGPLHDVEMVESYTPPGSPRPSAYFNPQLMYVPDAEVLEGEKCSQNIARKQGVIIGGGTIFYQRTRIILDVITSCGGVFPGNNELHYVFRGAWEKASNLQKTTMPDRATISKQIKMLVSDGTLRRLQFTFEVDNGRFISKKILTLAGVDPLSIEVKSLQQQMIKHHPQIYFPEQVSELAADVRARGPHRTFEIETEMAVEPMFPGAVIQRLEDRVKKTHEERIRDQRDRANERARERTAEKRAKRMQELQQASLVSGAHPVSTAMGGAGKLPGRLPRLPKLHTDNFAALLPPVQLEIEEEEVHGSRHFLSDSCSSDNDDDTERDSLSPETETSVSRQGDINAPSPIFLSTPEGTSPSNKYSDDSDLEEISREFFTERHETDGSTRYSKRRQHAATTFWKNPSVTFYPNIGTFSDEIVSRKKSTVSSPSEESPQPTKAPFPRCLEDITAQKLPRFRPAVDHEDYDWLVDPDHKKYFMDVYQVASWDFRHDYLVQKSQVSGKAEFCFINLTMPGKHVVANGQDIERPAAESAEQERRRRAGIEGHKHVPGTVWYTYEGSSENGQMAFTTKRAIEDVGAVERPAAKKRRVTFNLPGESSSHANGTQTKQSGLKKPRTALQKAKAAISENAASQLAYLDTVPPGPKRTRKKAAARPVDPNTADSEPKKRPTRRTRRLTRCVIDNDATDKLLYTIVVSKVLAGGIEQNVDWKIIGKVFKNHPKFNMSTFQKRWSTVKSRCTALVDRLTEQFQQHFIEAYEKGQAPTFDFDDPDSYDWVELVDWARNTLKQSSRSILLPEDRAEIYDHYTVEELPKQTDFQDHWYDGTMQTYIREREVADYVYSVPIEKFEVPRVGDPSMKEELLKAKSWLRASVANGAPVGSDAVQSVNEKLSKLDEDYIDEALSSLRGDGAFKLLKKGKNPLLGDDFTLSPAFYKQLNRVWDIDNLNDAVLFKQQLDEIFSAPTADKDNDVTMSGIDTESATPTLNPDARHPISLTLSSGALMVITTLLSTARAKLVPHLPAVDSTIGNPFPRLSVWGWTESNYRAVAMSREHIFWGLDLVPTAAYRFGNPLAENKGLGVGWDVSIVPPPLCQDGKIPIWCDLNESFVYAWWERAVVAVLGHLVLRAPASVASLSVALAKILERWEIERIVGWLVDVGAASFSADGSRVMPGDYWWCVLGTTDAGKVEVEKRRKIREVEAAAQKAKKKTGPPKGWRKPRPQVSGINIGYPITAAEDDGEWDGALLELAGVTGSGGEDDGSGVEDGADEVGEHDEGENGDVDGDGDVIMEG